MENPTKAQLRSRRGQYDSGRCGGCGKPAKLHFDVSDREAWLECEACGHSTDVTRDVTWT